MVDEKSNHSGSDKDITSITLPKPKIDNLRDARNESGVFRVMSESSIEREFITSGYSPAETISKTKLLDFNELNDLARYYDWLKDFNDDEGLETLNFWMNGKRSIGGYSLIHALFGKVGIVSPEALGVKMSKSEAQAINQYQKDRNNRRNDNDKNKDDNN
jgi:hypothetical protein